MATPSASGAGTGGSAMASAPAPAAPAAAPTATLPAGTPTSSPPTVVTATISARERHAEARIGADEWDVDAWHALLGEAALKPYSESEPLYKRICGQFPSHGRFWIERAQHCARSGGDSATVTSVYEEGVAATPTCVELWRGYLSYAASHATAGNTNSVLGIFERAVDAAGLDLHATNLWNDYIEYLRSRAVLADSQRRDALRRVYQRAVRTPMLQLDTVWRDYTTFEQKSNSNKEIGRVLLAEMQPKNVDARTECRARKARREGLSLAAVPVPPRGRAKDASQAAQWRKFIAAEVANPAALPGPELHARVVHAYESALCPLYRYPDVWLEYVTYLYDAHLPVLEVPVAGETPKAGVRGRDKAKLEEAIQALEPIFQRAAKATPRCVAVHSHIAALWERLGKPARAVSTLDAHAKSAPTPLAYVHLMRTVRRVEGRDAARRVFARARKETAAAHPAVYVAAAALEFSVNKDAKVARNVFEFGLKKFSGDATMARAFADWLWGTGEFEYLRVVLEKTVPKVSGDKDEVRALWELWIRVEDVLGDCASVDRVEELWAEKLAGGDSSGGGGGGGGNGTSGAKRPSPVSTVLRRYRYLGFQAMSDVEIAVVDAADATSTNRADDGKRDPRLRRSARGGGGGDTKTSTVISPQANGKMSLQVIIDRLNRLAANIPPAAFQGPPPAPDLCIQLVLKTPDSFNATPAGGGSGTSAAPKRTAPTAPPNDVFRARQAAKQARTR